MPSRFLDELPADHVDVVEPTGNYGGYGVRGMGGSYGPSRFDRAEPFQNTYTTPGWQRAQKNRRETDDFSDSADQGWGRGTRPASSRGGRFGRAARAGGPLEIEGELVAKSTGPASRFGLGERVFHQKFGYGEIASIEGNKLTVDFDKAGQKRVLDSFVERP
jgi:DNA helicase-2/ATP-dependent DNA helicase PcrA